MSNRPMRPGWEQNDYTHEGHLIYAGSSRRGPGVAGMYVMEASTDGWEFHVAGWEGESPSYMTEVEAQEKAELAAVGFAFEVKLAFQGLCATAGCKNCAHNEDWCTLHDRSSLQSTSCEQWAPDVTPAPPLSCYVCNKGLLPSQPTVIAGSWPIHEACKEDG